MEHKGALPPGTRLQELELREVIGHGGFGITYYGLELNLNRPVAVKEYLPSDFGIRESDMSVGAKSDADVEDFEWGLQRFLDEARTLARFDHPNLVKVYRFFRANGTGYIVMEYVEGESLYRKLSREGKLSEQALKDIIFPLLDGLELLHQAGFLHRDIKPGNIVIRTDGSPVLIDFGAARMAVGRRSRSVTTLVTPGFAPIEQYSTRGNQGPWSDIYALGAVCYRALIGETPPDATDRIRDDPMRPAAEAGKGTAGPGLLRAIDAALAVEEDKRLQSVAAFREALRQQPPVKAGKAKRSARAVGTGRPRKAGSAPPAWRRLALPAAGLALAGALVAALLLWRGPANGTRPQAGVASVQPAGEQSTDTTASATSSPKAGPEAPAPDEAATVEAEDSADPGDGGRTDTAAREVGAADSRVSGPGGKASGSGPVEPGKSAQVDQAPPPSSEIAETKAAAKPAAGSRGSGSPAAASGRDSGRERQLAKLESGKQSAAPSRPLKLDIYLRDLHVEARPAAGADVGNGSTAGAVREYRFRPEIVWIVPADGDGIDEVDGDIRIESIDDPDTYVEARDWMLEYSIEPGSRHLQKDRRFVVAGTDEKLQRWMSGMDPNYLGIRFYPRRIVYSDGTVVNYP